MQTFPQPMTPEEEQQCLRQYRQGSIEARDKLIERNLRLVVHIVKKYQSTEEDLEDLISVGTIGLMKAVSTFDAGRGKLATYAARCIENELLMMFRSRKKLSREVSMYEPIGSDKEGNVIHLIDVMESDTPDLVEELEHRRRQHMVYQLLNKLTPREREIVIHRYGLYGKKALTQREMGAMLGISRSYVSRIEKRALKKLREGFDGI